MHQNQPARCREVSVSLWTLLYLALLVCATSSGCVAITNPVANGIPVRRLPPELLGESRTAEQPLPLTMLRQPPPEAYRLAAGDVLGVWIPTLLGGKEGVAPGAEQSVLPPTTLTESARLPAPIGYPVPVEENGTITLPSLEPLSVTGMTKEQAERAIYEAYTVKKKILQPGARVTVTLWRRRMYHVLVFRQDAVLPNQQTGPTQPTGGSSITVSSTPASPTAQTGIRRSVGFAVDLPAYENDVLHALALTGGLPGLEAVNEVIVERGGASSAMAGVIPGAEACPPDAAALAAAGHGPRIAVIPMRLKPGQTPPFTPEDIVLQTGDIVFIQAREAELFYTGGILPSGAHLLPRDYDLDVLQAIAQVGGPIISSGVNPNNIEGQFVGGGFGFPSPSLCTVLRRTAGGGQVPIRVDLNRALRDPRERILIQPGDLVLLQERPDEAFGRYVSEMFHFSIFWQAIHGPHESGSVSGTIP
jgi:Polysaccharide biosynthesis/export protein